MGHLAGAQQHRCQQQAHAAAGPSRLGLGLAQSPSLDHAAAVHPQLAARARSKCSAGALHLQRMGRAYFRVPLYSIPHFSFVSTSQGIHEGILQICVEPGQLAGKIIEERLRVDRHSRHRYSCSTWGPKQKGAAAGKGCRGPYCIEVSGQLPLVKCVDQTCVLCRCDYAQDNTKLHCCFCERTPVPVSLFVACRRTSEAVACGSRGGFRTSMSQICGGRARSK